MRNVDFRDGNWEDYGAKDAVPVRGRANLLGKPRIAELCAYGWL